MTAATVFWWERTRCAAPGVPALQAVVFCIDAALADASDQEGALLGELVWALHCEDVQIAVVTAQSGPSVVRAVRDMLGDGAVEVLVTGDEADSLSDACDLALRQLGVDRAGALVVSGAIDASWSVRRCRELHRRAAGCEALSA